MIRAVARNGWTPFSSRDNVWLLGILQGCFRTTFPNSPCAIRLCKFKDRCRRQQMTFIWEIKQQIGLRVFTGKSKRTYTQTWRCQTVWTNCYILTEGPRLNHARVNVNVSCRSCFRAATSWLVFSRKKHLFWRHGSQRDGWESITTTGPLYQVRWSTSKRLRTDLRLLGARNFVKWTDFFGTLQTCLPIWAITTFVLDFILLSTSTKHGLNQNKNACFYVQ